MNLVRRRLAHTLLIAIGGLLLPVSSPTGSAEDEIIPWLEHLRVSVPEHATLLDAVTPLLRGAPAAVDPDLAVVTFRTGAAGIKDTVVQIYKAPGDDRAPVLNPQGAVRD